MKLSAPPPVESLDAQVAVKVMGLPETPWSRDVLCPYCKRHGRYCGSRSWCSNCAEWYYSAYKPYQDDVEAAMEVLAAIQSRYPGQTAMWVTKEGKFIVQVWDGNDGELANELAETLPEAICLAALKAFSAPAWDSGTTQ